VTDLLDEHEVEVARLKNRRTCMEEELLARIEGPSTAMIVFVVPVIVASGRPAGGAMPRWPANRCSPG
jgi:hypothetical protein